MRAGHAQKVQLGIATIRFARMSGEYRRYRVSGHATEYGVNQAAGAGFSQSPHEIHGVVGGCRGRYPLQITQLIRAKTKYGENVLFKFSRGTTCRMFDQVIQGALPAECTACQFRHERAIPGVY